MKKIGKIIGYILLSILAFILVLVIAAAMMQNKIVKLAIDEVSKTTNIPIQVGEIDFSLIRNFPLATLECKKLTIEAPGLNGQASDTLANVGKMFISVELKPLLNSVFKIREIEVEDASVYYSVDTAGISNYEFLMDTTTTAIDTAGNAIYLNIKELNLKNVACVYRDAKLKATADLLIEKLKLSGLIDNNRYLGEVKAEAKLSNCSLDSTNLYRMNQADIKLDLDYRDSLLTVNAAELTLDNDARLALNGSLKVNRQLPAKLALKAEECNLAALAKYIPEQYLGGLGIRTIAGQLDAEAEVEGNLGDSILPRTSIKLALSEGVLQYQDYPELKNITLKGTAVNGSDGSVWGSSLKVDAFSFETAKSQASLSGKVTRLDKPYYELQSRVKLDLSEWAAFVPDSLVSGLGGQLEAVVSTKGLFPGTLTDTFIQSIQKNSSCQLTATNLSFALDSNLSLKNVNGQLAYKPGQLNLSGLACSVPAYKLNVRRVDADVAVTGDFMKPESLAFQIKELAAATDSCELKLSGELNNPMAPDYRVNGQLSLDLDEIEKLLPAGTVKAMSGKVAANFSSKAKINVETIADDAMAIAFENSHINLALNRVTVQMDDSLMSVKGLTGKINYAADSLWLSGVRVNYMGVQFGADSTSITSLYSGVLQNKAKEMRVHGNFSVDRLDYSWVEALMARLEEEPTPTGPAADSDEPTRYTYKINGRVKANQLIYEGNVFKTINSKFLVRENHFVFDQLKMDAFDGTSLSSIKVDFVANDQMEIYFHTDVKQMDVTKLIDGFHDYMELDDIKAENVQGKISTKMDGKIVVDKDYNPVYNSLMLKGDLTLENGALIQVKPVMEIEKIPGVGLKNMDKLHFSTLNSSIFLFNNKLYIPKTEIRTSSFDAMFLGMWSFGEDYAYHVRMFLGEVLSSKSKANLRKQMQDNGFEEDDSDLTKGRSSMYLVSKFEDGKEKAWFDNKKDRANMEAKVKMQEGVLKFTFHPSFISYETE